MRRKMICAITYCLLAFTTLWQPTFSFADQPSNHLINIKDLGAVGDGQADDTAAFQKAFDTTSADISEILIPAGRYRITQTLTFKQHAAKGMIIRGQGGVGWKHWPKASTLVWDGPEGGTLLQTVGMGGCSFSDINFDGSQKAGVLFLANTVKGWGNMINSMNNVSFYRANIGIQMGSVAGEHNNSDYIFQNILFGSLKNGFLVKNDQGVDFLFNFIFALRCDTILNFERGGNLQVNNAQMTNCKLFLDVGGGGRNAGTFLCNNIRIESSDGGANSRYQLVKSYPKWQQAIIKFINYDDVQHAWIRNPTPDRIIPLCDIGPGSMVIIESSIFNSPLANLNGTAEAPANLITRDCSFSFVQPQDTINANEYGYFKLLGNMTSKMSHLQDIIKWPVNEPITHSVDQIIKGQSMQPAEQ